MIIYKCGFLYVLCLQLKKPDFRKGSRKNLATEDQMVVTPVHPGVKMKQSQMNDVNSDYANRSGFHQTHNMEQSRFK